MTSPEKIRVLIFDDHAHIREMYTMLINKQDDMLLVGAFTDCKMAVKVVEKTLPDVILMDIQMPGRSGIDAVKEIKQKFPGIKIIMQTVFGDDDNIFESICNGASGYLLKNASMEEFLNAIRQINNGGAPMSPEIAVRVLELFRIHGAHRHKAKEVFHLTAREKEILTLLTNGLSYKMIAAQLEIKFATVDSHIQHIYEKLHVNSATEAVKKALENKIV